MSSYAQTIQTKQDHTIDDPLFPKFQPEDLPIKSLSRGSGSHNTTDGDRLNSRLQKPFSSTFVNKMSLQT